MIISSIPFQEIISIHIGQAGVQVGGFCWELYCKEHNIAPDGSHQDAPGSPSVLFSETSSGKLVPRSVFADLEPTVVEGVRSGVYKDLYHPDLFVTGKEDAGSLFSRGHYGAGREKIEECCDKIRKQVEQCEHFQGFMIYSSLGGGTGSGFTSLLGNRLVVAYKNCKTKMHLTVFPSPKLSPVIVEPYNGVLGVHNGMDITDSMVLFDNESLYNVCTRYLDIERPSYSNLNRLISQVAASITASSRFEGSISTNLSTIHTNLIPYPRIKYLMGTYAPLISPDKASHERLTVSDMTQACFEHSAKTLSMDLRIGKLLSSCILYRGSIAAGEVNSAIADLKSRTSLKFTKWVPSSFKVGLVSQAPVHDGVDLAAVQRSACALSNHCAQESTWYDINWKYDKLFSRRAFVHWYYNFGMEESEMRDAREETAAVEKDYYYENKGGWGYCCNHRYQEDCEDDSEESDID